MFDYDCLEKTDLEDLDPVDQIPHNSRDLGPILGSMSWGDMFFLQGTHCIPEEKRTWKKPEVQKVWYELSDKASFAKKGVVKGD